MFATIFKFNPNHDDHGRFATVDDAKPVEGGKVAGMVLGMAERGGTPDIMNMVVDGKKPFGGGRNLGIPRIKMPQIPQPMHEAFLKTLGVKVTSETIDPLRLRATQDQLNGSKVGDFYTTLLTGREVKPVIVSKDGFILDGHHHWGARVVQRLTDSRVKVPITRVDIGIRPLLKKALAFAKEHDIASKPISKGEGFSAIFKEGTSEGADKAWVTRRNGGAPEVGVTGKSALTKGQFVSVKRDGATWSRTDGKPLTPDEHARLKALVIPPAYKSVKFNLDPMGRVQATGVNAVGKVQSKYHEQHMQEAAMAKWDRVNDFHKSGIRTIESHSARDMNDPNRSELVRDTAATANLIVHTGFRPGSDTDTHAQEQAYGASTLEKRHITVDGNKISFQFTGKKGVPIEKSIHNKALATYLSAKLPSKAPTDKIFSTSDSLLRQYVKKVTGDDHFKTKDIRTWNGTGVAYKLTRSMPAPTTLKDLKKARNEIGDKVAAHLGNTRTVALSSYVAPYVFHAWERGLGVPQGSTSMKPPRKAKKEEDGFAYNAVCEAMDQASRESEDRSPLDWRTLPDDEDQPYMVYKLLEPV
jgi:DNA topoisomerase-1